MDYRWSAGMQNEITFVMVDSARNELTGLSPTLTIRHGGGAFQASDNAVTEISDGFYSYISSVDEAEVGPISIVVTAPGAIQQNLEYVCEQRTPYVKFWEYRVTDQPGGAGSPIQGVYVWVTATDTENAIILWDGYTNASGYAKDGNGRNPLVPVGNNYFWKFKPGFVDDDNPDLEVVS